MLFWFLFALFLLSCAVTVIGPVTALRRTRELSGRPHRLAATAVALFLIIATGTIVYMELTLRRFATAAGEPIHGLIGRPVPNSGGDHEYTSRGRDYKFGAFQLPFYVSTAAIAALLAIIAGLARSSRRQVLIPSSAAAAGATAAIFVFWVCREFTAWDIFI